ncbi:MAG: hypothetical protein ACOCX0_06325 [Bacteroidota bacterium]
MQANIPVIVIRKLVLSWLFLFFVAVHAQEQEQFFTLPDYKAIMESYFGLSDSVLRAEIGSFSFVGTMMGKDSVAGLKEFEVDDISLDNVSLLLDDVSVSIAVSRFKPLEHTLGYVPGEDYLIYIDHKPYWGYDGRIPQRKIDSVVVNYEGFSAILPPESFSDLFEPNLCRRSGFLFFRGRTTCQTRAFLSADNNRIYIHMVNGRYPHYYEVTWIIQNGRYVGRVLDYSH